MRLFRRLLSLALVLLLVSGIMLPAGQAGMIAGAANGSYGSEAGKKADISDLNVNSKPEKTSYTVGEKLSIEGLTVKLHYKNDRSEIVETSDFAKHGITVTPADGTVLTEAGKIAVTVTCGEFSEQFEIEVLAPELEKITINTMPAVTEYNEGDKLSLEGLTVKLHYSDGSSEIVETSDFAKHGIAVTPADGTVLTEAGKNTVTVTCGEFSEQFGVEVEASRLEKITINTMPAATEYKQGDKLSLEGLTVKLHYKDGSSEIVETSDFAKHGITVTPADGTVLTEAGKNVVTVSCGEFSEQFGVEVEASRLEKITINTMPAATEYNEGDKLSLEGLTVKLHYKDGSSEIVEISDFAKHGIAVTPADGTVLTEAGKNVVTVTCSNLTAEFELDVLPAEREEREIDRIYGSDRYETALAISAKGWDKAENVLIACGHDFADALAGAALSKELNAPILLVSDGDNSHVWAEIERLGAENVCILGGSGAVSESVETELTAMGLKVERLSGSDRYATAAAIAQKLASLGQNTDKAFIVSGESFADALSAGYASAITGSPILYTNSDRLNDTTGKYIADNGITEVSIIGGSAAVSEDAEAELSGLANVNRISGSDRYGTSLEVAKAFFNAEGRNSIAVATGKNFPDALTGGAYAVRLGVPVLLVGDQVSEELLGYLEDCGTSRVILFGGENALSAETAEALK